MTRLGWPGSISNVHQQFLNDGGLGLLIGDGMLPHPGPEQIIETYYAFPLRASTVTFDYQFIINPAYNRDRGPISVIGARACIRNSDGSFAPFERAFTACDIPAVAGPERPMAPCCPFSVKNLLEN
jgi:hypothetical protein